MLKRGIVVIAADQYWEGGRKEVSLMMKKKIRCSKEQASVGYCFHHYPIFLKKTLTNCSPLNKRKNYYIV